MEWKDTDESRELQACLLWNLDPEADPEETPSFFSVRYEGYCEWSVSRGRLQVEET